MKKCYHCETENSDDSRYCAECGAVLPDTSASDAFNAVAPAVEINKSAKPTETKKEAGIKEKAIAFENKHKIIVNLLVMVCAIVIMFVALFVPIKVSNSMIETSEGNFEYTEVNQSIFQILGSFMYINASPEKEMELAKDLDEATSAASSEFDEWVAKHPNATIEEEKAAYSKITADHLSDVNFFGLVFVMAKEPSGALYSAMISAAFGVIIAILAIIMAIMSLVFLIKSIIGMVKNKQQTKMYKYFGAMLSLSGAGLSMMFAAPLLKAGGGMFAIVLFISLVMLACGILGSLLFGHDGLLTIIRRTITAAFTVVAFLILCSNIFCLKADGEQLNVASGYPLHRMLSLLDTLDKGTLGLYASAITGLIFYILMVGFAMSFAFSAMKRSLNCVAFGDSAKSPKAYMIVSAVFMLISIILGWGFSDMLTEKLTLLFRSAVYTPSKWIMNAQVWASMILLIIATIVEFVFGPKKKEVQPAPSANEQPAQNA